jgi:hypothetical protein
VFREGPTHRPGRSREAVLGGVALWRCLAKGKIPGGKCTRFSPVLSPLQNCPCSAPYSQLFQPTSRRLCGSPLLTLSCSCSCSCSCSVSKDLCVCLLLKGEVEGLNGSVLSYERRPVQGASYCCCYYGLCVVYSSVVAAVCSA